MTIFKKGDTVTQIVAPISGEVTGFQVDQETGTLQVLVSWSDSDGDHSRYFNQDDITKSK